jgi:hypothetical protein
MSLKGMAESRRREGDQAVWLKCSKCVADWTQAWPRCIAPAPVLRGRQRWLSRRTRPELVDSIVKQPISNSRFQTANAPPPVFFIGAPGKPTFRPLQRQGNGAPCGATSSPTPRGVDVPLRQARSPHGAPSRLFCPRDRASGRGHLIQAAFAALHPRLVQPSKAAPRSWSGRRPGASRRRGCETTPAGAASGSATKTPLDDALAVSRTHRTIVSVGLKSRAASPHREEGAQSASRRMGRPHASRRALSGAP